MPDIFISYARVDRDRIELLSRALEAEGFDVWWDRHIAPGSHFPKETEARLNEARAIIVAWSRASVESMWVADEAEVGKRKRNLVPLTIDPVEPAIGFRQLQALPFDAWRGDALSAEFRALVAALKARIGDKQKAAAPAPTANAPRRAFALQPSIAVLPFENLSEAGDQEYFADGLVEDIITDLARIPQLLVVSRNAVFPFKGRDVALAKIGERLGVRYALRGSVRHAGDRLRVTAQLVDAASDHVLWSRKYDRNVAAIFEVQDELTDDIVSSLDVEIVSGDRDAIVAASIAAQSRARSCTKENTSITNMNARLVWPPGTISRTSSAASRIPCSVTSGLRRRGASRSS